MLSNKRNPVQNEYPQHERISHDRLSTKTLNPLTLFPSKKDTLTKAFFTIDIPSHKMKKESKERWLDPNQLNPEFGIKVSDIS